jgi:hypothetical protein
MIMLKMKMKRDHQIAEFQRQHESILERGVKQEIEEMKSIQIATSFRFTIPSKISSRVCSNSMVHKQPLLEKIADSSIQPSSDTCAYLR